MGSQPGEGSAPELCGLHYPQFPLHPISSHPGVGSGEEKGPALGRGGRGSSASHPHTKLFVPSGFPRLVRARLRHPPLWVHASSSPHFIHGPLLIRGLGGNSVHLAPPPAALRLQLSRASARGRARVRTHSPPQHPPGPSSKTLLPIPVVKVGGKVFRKSQEKGSQDEAHQGWSGWEGRREQEVAVV